MPTITIPLDSTLPPERVLAAAMDFSERRSKVFPAVEPEHFTVHNPAEPSADVTEGTHAGIGVNWERCRYEWSGSEEVIATVTDSTSMHPEVSGRSRPCRQTRAATSRWPGCGASRTALEACSSVLHSG